MVTRRAVVTGATGGLGRLLVPALAAQGWTVVCTGRRVDLGRTLVAPGVSFVPADLSRDSLDTLLAGADSVFHLAALSSPWGRQPAFVQANVTATQRLLAAASAAGCRRFIHTSTPSIFVDRRHRMNLREDSPLPAHGVNDYARTKLAAERLVLQAASPAMATVVLRPRAIVSPFDTVLLPRLMRAAQRGRIVLPAGGQALVELTDGRDVVAALLAACARAEALSGRVFNISGGQPRPLSHIVSRVFQAMGRPLSVRSVPPALAFALGALAEGLALLLPSRPEPPLTRYGAMVASWSQTFDLTAARTDLQWSPRHSPEEAIDWALQGDRHA